MKRKIIPDNEFLKKLGNAIRSFRKKQKMSQPVFSKRLKMSQSSLDRYEKGQSNMPILALKDISDAYDIKIEDLLIEIEKPSEMLKAVASIKTGGRRKYPERIKGDAEFDEYMKQPENEDKLQALYHLYRLSEYVPDSFNVQIMSHWEHSMISNETDIGQAERLTKYMRQFAAVKKGED